MVELAMSRPHELSQDLVGEFVQAAHFSLAKVQALHQHYPALLNARWEKYNELAIEAAGHIGQRAISEYLLTHGAPLQIFVAASLGNTQAVARFLHDDPSLANAPCIHGISLCYPEAFSGNLDVLVLIDQSAAHQRLRRGCPCGDAFGHTPVVAWLLGHAATDLTLRNFDQTTPLQMATGQRV